jgi:hypothetical protein
MLSYMSLKRALKQVYVLQGLIRHAVVPQLAHLGTDYGSPGTHFTCFTGTKVQILTPGHRLWESWYSVYLLY